MNFSSLLSSLRTDKPNLQSHLPKNGSPLAHSYPPHKSGIVRHGACKGVHWKGITRKEFVMIFLGFGVTLYVSVSAV